MTFKKPRLGRNGTPCRCRGFTLPEMLLVICTLAMLGTLLILGPGCNKGPASSPSGSPSEPPSGSSAARMDCAHRLKNVAMAFQSFANDKGGLPMEVPRKNGGSKEDIAGGAAYPHFLALSNELSAPDFLVCPSDNRRKAASWADLKDENVSYFVGLDAQVKLPIGLLAGDRNLALDGRPVTSGVLKLTANSNLGWSDQIHGQRGYVAFSEGSVQLMDQTHLRAAVRENGLPQFRLAMP